MNIPFKQETIYKVTNTHSGNSGNGSRINKPTILVIDYSPSYEFIIGEYNNNIQPTYLPTVYLDTDQLQYNTNNSIDGVSFVNNKSGNNGSGGNLGSHYKPNQWSPYTLQPIPGVEKPSQTFPYDTNSTFIQGSTRRAWASFESANVNNSQGLEQITPTDKIVPMERTEPEQYRDAVKKLIEEMN
jgi:hypothetical protein